METIYINKYGKEDGLTTVEGFGSYQQHTGGFGDIDQHSDGLGDKDQHSDGLGDKDHHTDGLGIMVTTLLYLKVTMKKDF